jgi:hypothetical protein
VQPVATGTFYGCPVLGRQTNKESTGTRDTCGSNRTV